MELSQKHREQLQRWAPDHLKVIEATMRDQPAQLQEMTQAEPVEAPEFTIDLSNVTQRLTVGDVEDIEDATGLSIQDVFQRMQERKVKGLAAIVWVLRRKDDPEFTLDRARNMALTQMMSVVAPKEVEESPLDDSASASA